MPSHLPPPKHDQSKAPSLRRVVLRAFPGTTSLSDSLPASRDFSPPALYARSLPDRLPGRVSPVPRCSVPTCHRLRPRGGPASVPVQDAVCCLRRDMIGSALPNAFRLTICRGCSVHVLLRPAGLLPSVSRAFDTPLGAGGSLRSAGVCYRALRRLPGQDFHLLEQRVFQDAPWKGQYNSGGSYSAARSAPTPPA